jgi:N-acetylneuraminic acid mutarotase
MACMPRSDRTLLTALIPAACLRVRVRQVGPSPVLMHRCRALAAASLLAILTSCATGPPPDLPKPTVGAAATVAEGKVYVLGGRVAGGNQPADTVLEYGSSGSWETRKPLPEGRESGAAVCIDGRIFVAGGRSRSAVLARLDIYDPKTDTWTSGSPMSTPRYNHAAAAVGGKLYILGGAFFNPAGNAQELSSVEVYDPVADAWTLGPALPKPLQDAAVAVVKDRIYVIGGESAGTPDSAAVMILDTAKSRWLIGAPLHEARDGMGAAVIDGRIYVTGGYDGVVRSDAVEVYDPEAHSWSKAGSLVHGRSHHASLEFRRDLLAIGGISRSGDTANVEAVGLSAPVPGTDGWSPVELASALSQAPRTPAETLTPQAGRLCAAAFRAGRAPAGPPPTLTPRSLLFLEGGQDGTWAGSREWFPALKAESADQVRCVVCIKGTLECVGTYRPLEDVAPGIRGSDVPAERLRWDVRVLEWPEGRVLAGTSLMGKEPPEITTRQFMSVDRPDDALSKWLAGGLRMVDADFVHYQADVLAFSPDGQILASGDGGRIVLWDIAGHRPVRTLKHVGRIGGLVFSPDGRLLAAGAQYTESSQTLKIWEVSTGRQMLSLEPGGPTFSDVAISPDGSIVALAAGKTIKLWNIERGREIGAWKGHDEQVYALTFSRDGKLLVSGSYDRTVRVWNVADGQEVHVLTGHTGAVRSAAFSRDGRVLATGSSDGVIRLWDAGTWTETNRVFQPGPVQGLAFASSGNLVSGEYYVDVLLWDVVGRRIRKSFDGQAFAVSCDGGVLASVKDGGIRLSALP